MRGSWRRRWPRLGAGWEGGASHLGGLAAQRAHHLVAQPAPLVQLAHLLGDADLARAVKQRLPLHARHLPVQGALVLGPGTARRSPHHQPTRPRVDRAGTKPRQHQHWRGSGDTGKVPEHRSGVPSRKMEPEMGRARACPSDFGHDGAHCSENTVSHAHFFSSVWLAGFASPGRILLVSSSSSTARPIQYPCWSPPSACFSPPGSRARAARRRA